MNLPGSVCKQKWQNLRTVLIRHMKPPSSKSGTRIKKPYYLADAMQFAIPFTKPQMSTVSGNLSMIRQLGVDHEDIEEDSKEFFSLVTTNPSPSFQPRSLPSPPPQPNSLPYTSSDLPFSTLSLPKKNNRKSKNKMSDVDNNFNENPKSKKAKIDNTDQVQIARKMFLLSILPDVYTMSNTQMRSFKRKVLCLLDEIVQETADTSSQHFILSDHNYL